MYKQHYIQFNKYVVKISERKLRDTCRASGAIMLFCFILSKNEQNELLTFPSNLWYSCCLISSTIILGRRSRKVVC